MSSKKNPTPYPDRPAIIRAARSGDESLFDRLTEEDRALYLLYRDFPLAGEPALSAAPANWVRKAMAIPEVSSARSIMRRLAGVLIFDSWAGLPAIGTRSTATEERRLRFAADHISLDLRAEHRRGGWQFTARLSGLAAETLPVMLADRQEVFADTEGFYHWTSPAPPVQISLKSPTYLIELAEITWHPDSRS